MHLSDTNKSVSKFTLTFRVTLNVFLNLSELQYIVLKMRPILIGKLGVLNKVRRATPGAYKILNKC